LSPHPRCTSWCCLPPTRPWPPSPQEDMKRANHGESRGKVALSRAVGLLTALKSRHDIAVYVLAQGTHPVSSTSLCNRTFLPCCCFLPPCVHAFASLPDEGHPLAVRPPPSCPSVHHVRARMHQGRGPCFGAHRRAFGAPLHKPCPAPSHCVSLPNFLFAVGAACCGSGGGHGRCGHGARLEAV
jgi:hypothetical protein